MSRRQRCAFVLLWDQCPNEHWLRSNHTPDDPSPLSLSPDPGGSVLGLENFSEVQNAPTHPKDRSPIRADNTVSREDSKFFLSDAPPVPHSLG